MRKLIISNSTVLLIAFLSIILYGCKNEQEQESNNNIPSANWKTRVIENVNTDSLEYGKSYLSIYSLIYSETEHRTHNLTVMVSLRNTSDQDTVYIKSSNYFDTNGKLVRSYHKDIVFLAPMETIEIIIEEFDISGGTGSNFLFEWYTPPKSPDPIFEAVMSSTMARGISFMTIAKRID